MRDREDASSMVTAGATANTTEGNSRASRESGLLSSHSHEESIGTTGCNTPASFVKRNLTLRRIKKRTPLSQTTNTRFPCVSVHLGPATSPRKTKTPPSPKRCLNSNCLNSPHSVLIRACRGSRVGAAAPPRAR